MEGKSQHKSLPTIESYKSHHDNKAYQNEKDGLKSNPSNGSFDLPPDYNSKEDEEPHGAISLVQTKVSNFYNSNLWTIWSVIGLILFGLYCWYLVEAMMYELGTEPAYRLLIGKIAVLVFLLSLALLSKFPIKTCTPKLRNWKKISAWIHRSVAGGLVIFAIAYIIAEIGIKTPNNLISLGGMAALLLFTFLFSQNPAKVDLGLAFVINIAALFQVKWGPVFWGIMLQFIFALIILRWRVGYEIFQLFGDRVLEFLAYTDKGSIFVFGESYEVHFFAMKVLPVMVFFSSVVSILYYFGAMQFVIRILGKGLATILGTSAVESVNAAENIFLGQQETPLMIRPFVEKLTLSEIHAVCTGGFATIAGSIMAAYIIYGVPANHLLSASVMSAPAALAISKLFWPETDVTRTRIEDVYNMKKGPEGNIIDAASRGASNSIGMIANVAVNLIAFYSLLAFVNATLRWFGERAGMKPPSHEYITFQYICSYVFYPLAFIMGVESGDCRRVAELIGLKIFINEFVAYKALAVYIDNQKNLTWYESQYNSTIYNDTWHYDNGDIVYNYHNITLENGILQAQRLFETVNEIPNNNTCQWGSVSALVEYGDANEDRATYSFP